MAGWVDTAKYTPPPRPSPCPVRWGKNRYGEEWAAGCRALRVALTTELQHLPEFVQHRPTGGPVFLALVGGETNSTTEGSWRDHPLPHTIGTTHSPVSQAIDLFLSKGFPLTNTTPIELSPSRDYTASIANNIQEMASMLEHGDLIGVVGPESNTCQVIGHIAARHNLPVMCPRATSDDLGGRKLPTLRLLQPTDDMQGSAMASLLHDLGVDKGVAVLYEANEMQGALNETILGCSYAARLARAFTTAAAAKGIQVDAILPVFEDTTNFRVLQEKSIQIMVLAASRKVGWSVLANAARFTYAFGAGKMWVVSETMATFAPPSSSELEGVIGIAPLVDSNIKQNLTTDVVSMLYGDAVHAILLAAQRAGALNNTYTSAVFHKPEKKPWEMGDAMMAQLDSMSFEGYTGEVVVDPPARFNLMNLLKGGWEVRGTMNQSDGWVIDLPNVIWPGRSASFPRRRDLLKGQTLRILYVVDTRGIPVVLSKKSSSEVTRQAAEKWCAHNETLCGVIPSIITMLQEELDFNVEYEEQDGNYSGAIDRIWADEPFDMACATFVITHERSEKVDFTERYHDTSFRLYVKPLNKNRNIWAFLNPFVNEVWSVLAAMVFISAFLFWVLERGYNDYVERGIDGFFTSVWWSITGFFSVHDAGPVSNGGRLVGIGLYIVAFLCISAYTANLVVFLQRRSFAFKVESINDFEGIDTDEDTVKASVPLSQLAIQQDTAYHTWLQKASGRPGGWQQQTGTLPFDFVRNGSAVGTIYLAMYTSFLREVTDCELQLAPISQVGDVLGLGFALPKGSPYNSILSDVVLRLREEGKIKALIDKYLSGRCGVTDSFNKDEETPLSVHELGGAFIVYMVLVGAAIFVRLFRVFVLPAFPQLCKDALRIDDGAPDGSVEHILGARGKFCSGIRRSTMRRRSLPSRSYHGTPLQSPTVTNNLLFEPNPLHTGALPSTSRKVSINDVCDVTTTTTTTATWETEPEKAPSSESSELPRVQPD